MNFRKTCILFIFFSFLFIKAQKVNIIVEYDYHFMTLNFRGFLLANEKQSYFFFTKDLDQNYDNLSLNNYKGLNSIYPLKFDFKEDASYQKALFLGNSNAFKSKLTKDEFILDWKIGTDKRKILDYNCLIATTTFRGNHYKVWFTTEIKSTIFPWKLKGLPGVILSFEDESGFFRGDALSVSTNKIVNFPPKIISFFDEHQKDAMTYKEYITVENKLLQENMSEKVAQLPTGTKYELPELRQMQLEKTFEWETQPEKP